MVGDFLQKRSPEADGEKQADVRSIDFSWGSQEGARGGAACLLPVSWFAMYLTCSLVQTKEMAVSLFSLQSTPIIRASFSVDCTTEYTHRVPPPHPKPY